MGGGQVGILSLAGRYARGNSTLSGSVSTYFHIALGDDDTISDDFLYIIILLIRSIQLPFVFPPTS